MTLITLNQEAVHAEDLEQDNVVVPIFICNHYDTNDTSMTSVMSYDGGGLH